MWGVEYQARDPIRLRMHEVNTIHGEDIIAEIVDKQRVENTKYDPTFWRTKTVDRWHAAYLLRKTGGHKLQVEINMKMLLLSIILAT